MLNPYTREKIESWVSDFCDSSRYAALSQLTKEYAEVVLVIHTDEFYIVPSRVTELISDHVFSLQHRNLTRAFLLFSYSPEIGRCPYIQLRLATAPQDDSISR